MDQRLIDEAYRQNADARRNRYSPSHGTLRRFCELFCNRPPEEMPQRQQQSPAVLVAAPLPLETVGTLDAVISQSPSSSDGQSAASPGLQSSNKDKESFIGNLLKVLWAPLSIVLAIVVLGGLGMIGWFVVIIAIGIKVAGDLSKRD
jgi:hypothetical protein